jgi:hypothetical protein
MLLKEEKMLLKRLSSTAFSAALMLGLVIMPAVQTTAQEKSAAKAKPTDAKICQSCHQPEPGNLRGTFESVAFKSQSIQIKIDDAVEIVKFDPDAVKVVDAGAPAEAEALRGIKKGHEVRVEYTEKDGVKTAVLLASKPPIKVAPEKLMTTADVEKLVAMGPGKGKYTLVDSRPAPRFQEGAVPTAINIPYPAFDKMKDKLPGDKDALLVFYCGGMT